MNSNLKYLTRAAYQIRKNVVEAIGIDHRGHFGGALSCADLLAALYFRKMKYDPGNTSMPDRDRFILSKGHAVPGLYATLAEAGYFPKSDLKTLKELGSHLQGHPDVLKTPGIEANTGSLGQGLSIGLGMALGLRMDKINARVYVILGDGEMGEGQVWEAGMVAAHYRLNKLIAIIDHNKIQAMGRTCDRINIGSLADKWKAFGWEVMEVDGHKMEAIVDILDRADAVKDKPVMIIAHTVKGKGISFAENTAAFHNNLMTNEQWNLAMEELDIKIKELEDHDA